jgi:hypothetical protein
MRRPKEALGYERGVTWTHETAGSRGHRTSSSRGLRELARGAVGEGERGGGIRATASRHGRRRHMNDDGSTTGRKTSELMGARGRPRRTMGGPGFDIASGNARVGRDLGGSQGFHPQGARIAKDHSSRNGSRGFRAHRVNERGRASSGRELPRPVRWDSRLRASGRCQKRTNEKDEAVPSTSRHLRGARIPRRGMERRAQTVRRSEGARRAHP